MSILKRKEFLLCLLFVNIFLMATIKIGDYDIWYHLRAGQHILSTGKILQIDPFSYTVTDRPWSLQSWLAGVIFYLVQSLSGIEGLILFNAAVITGAFFFLYLTMRQSMKEEDGLVAAVILVAIAAFTARFRFMVRPHVLEFLFLSIMLYLLNLYRSTGKNRLFFLPLIQILWVNIHGSHILGLIVPLLFLTGEAVQYFSDYRNGVSSTNQGRMRVYGLVALADVAATFVNPDTYRAFLLPFTITGQKVYMSNIGEWQPLRLHHLWGYGLSYTWGFVVLVILAVWSFIRLGKRQDYTNMLLFLFFLASAIKGIRLSAEFGIAAAAIIFANLSRSGAFQGKGWEGGGIPRLATLLLLVTVVPVAVFSNRTFAFGLGVKDHKFPDRALAFLDDNRIKGNMFNSYAFGDYLTWHSPQRKVFIHGRADVFPEEFYTNYLKAHEKPAIWQELAQRYGINYALLEHYGTDLSGKEQIGHLMGNPEWVPVYWDATAIVYLKRTPENQPVIDRCGYAYIRPTFPDLSYLDHYLKRGLAEKLLEEFDRLARQSPDCEEAYLGRAFVFYYLKNFDKAKGNVSKALSINPRRAMSHSAMGLLYQSEGKKDEARQEFKAALKLDPHDEAAAFGMKTL